MLKKLGLSQEWSCLINKYHPTEVLFQDYFNVKVKAVDQTNGKFVIIKQVRRIFNTDYQARKVLREIAILRQLSAIEGNVFTSKLLEVIIPGVDLQAIAQSKKVQAKPMMRTMNNSPDRIRPSLMGGFGQHVIDGPFSP